MKLLINTASTHKGGSVQVARSFIEECRNISEHEYHIILGNRLSKLIDKNVFPSNFSFYSLGYRPATRVLSIQSQDRDLKQIEGQVKPDVVFTTSGPAYWRPEVPHVIGYNLPHYIYRDSPFFDNLAIFERLKWDLKGIILKYYFKRDGDVYVVQTEDVKIRLKEWLNCTNIYTVSNTFSNYYTGNIKSAPKLPKKSPRDSKFRFLTLSAWYPHKNLEIIPRVIEKLPSNVRKRVQFVLTLPDRDFKENLSTEYKDHIINTGPVTPEEGPSLYEECDALFLPTLLECFSASYAEAMQMEKPIITSDLSFARSICKDAALYFDPTDPADIALKICELIENPSIQNKLIEEGNLRKTTFLNSQQRANEYIRICSQLCDARKN